MIAEPGIAERNPGLPQTTAWPRRLVSTARRFGRLFGHPLVAAATAFVVIAIMAALFAPLLPLDAPNSISPADRLHGLFSPGHVLGTDDIGRDVLSRVVWGARPSLLAGTSSALLALILGLASGLVAGYFKGRIDAVLMRLIDVLMAFPMLFLAIAIVAVLGPGLRNAVVALSLASCPLYARVVRSVVLSLREREFITAAVTLGATHWHTVTRHILPNLIAPITVLFTLDVGAKIVGTAGLSFLGLGTQPPDADWGTMLATGRQVLTLAPHVAVVPALAIFVFVLSLNLLGDHLSEAVDPTLRASA